MALMALSACFDSEPKERQAFIDFLNSHYLKQQGGGVAVLNEKFTKEIGRYVEHHNVFTYYHDETDKLMASSKQGVENLLKSLNYDNIEETIASLEKNKEEVAKMLAENEAAYTKTLAMKNDLKMPDELKAVYEQAFEKSVVILHDGVKTLFGQPLDDVFNAKIKLLKFLQNHQDKIKITGRNRVELDDQALYAELKPLLADVNDKVKAWEAARREVRNSVRGVSK